MKHQIRKPRPEKLVRTFAERWAAAKPCKSCLPCTLKELCERRWAPFVTTDLLENQEWLRDFKNHTAARALHGSLWLQELIEMNAERRLPFSKVLKDGSRGPDIDPPLHRHFFPSEDDLLFGQYAQFTNTLYRWLDRFLNRTVADDAVVFVSEERKETACIVASLICLSDVGAASKFGLRP